MMFGVVTEGPGRSMQWSHPSLADPNEGYGWHSPWATAAHQINEGFASKWLC